MSDLKVLEQASPPREIDATAVRDQLERIVLDPQFSHSRRYPKLLRFVVEHTLNHSGSELKERTLGVDVFGRNPDYDTGLDPVVRITAGEVRKRLAHYYLAPEREDEIRISLPIGSYVPEFRLPASSSHKEPDRTPVVFQTVASPVARRGPAWKLLAIPAALAICGVIWWSVPRPSALDGFWNPVLGKSGSVLLSVGQREETVPVGTSTAVPPDAITLNQLYYLQSQNVAMPDVVALAHLGALMHSRHVRYRIRSASQTSLSDLRDGPVILVGAFTNEWNMRLNKPLRFSFDRQSSLSLIRDSQNPLQLKWAVDYEMPYLKLTTDYALITRVIDPASERFIVTAGGIGGYGTQAAGEFLTDPAYMQKLMAVAPRDWERKNLQVVISTRVINGSSGPPEIVSSVFW